MTHLHQFVHLPTRYSRTSSSILDIPVVLSSYPADISKVMVERELITVLSASRPLFLQTFPSVPPRRFIFTVKGNFTQLMHDLPDFAAQLSQSVPSSRYVNDNWLMFKQAVLAALEKHIPSKMVNDRCRQPPWLNCHANRAIKKQDHVATPRCTSWGQWQADPICMAWKFTILSSCGLVSVHQFCLQPVMCRRAGALPVVARGDREEVSCWSSV